MFSIISPTSTTTTAADNLLKILSTPVPTIWIFAGVLVPSFFFRCYIEGKAREVSKNQEIKVSKVDWTEKILLGFVRFAEIQQIVVSGIQLWKEQSQQQEQISSPPSIVNSSSSSIPLWKHALLCTFSLIGYGLFAKRHRALGPNYSITLELYKNHRLVTFTTTKTTEQQRNDNNDGSNNNYSSATRHWNIVRHGMYTSMLIVGIGKSLYQPTPVSSASSSLIDVWSPYLYLLAVGLMSAIRIPKEEKMLAEEFGEEFEEYCEATPYKLIPILY